MAATNVTGSLNLAANAVFTLKLASHENLQPEGRFDMPRGFSLDFNITSADAVGTLSIFLQNDDPASSSFLQTARLTFPVSGGTFVNSQTKQTLDSNGTIYTKYLSAAYTRTSGSGTISVIGQILYWG